MNFRKLSISLILSIGIVSLGFHFFYSSQHSNIIVGDGVHGPKGMVWIQGGQFLMVAQISNNKHTYKVY